MNNHNSSNPGDHTIHLRVSSRLFEEIKSLAVREQRSVSGMVKYIVITFLNNNHN
ncbi:hypothetical protein SAMN05444280_1622 [Tangfeifania diversioriginum]|uniref:Uncharacterized protein n=1 Tax=Tangfeifania diversioriginum TaxID=1168035 RepID=A0A1M6PJF7_9BACT|nr:hypothetical protein [Tangfeifania diversioriginum]SHK08091.1 hypothetical protein SAMN05444280_1622 [Tangfeifania diversioriginum]